MAVRTRTIAAASVTTTLTTFFTVPTDRVAIIKQIAVGKFATGANNITVTVLRSGVAYGLDLIQNPLAATVTNRSVYWVLQEGDALRAVADTGTATIWFSGTLLDGDPS